MLDHSVDCRDSDEDLGAVPSNDDVVASMTPSESVSEDLEDASEASSSDRAGDEDKQSDGAIDLFLCQCKSRYCADW